MTGIAVWRDGAADGPTNMALDECLAATAVARGGFVIRLYGWAATTLSLGGFQPLAAARACDAVRGLPLVRRPSGGGAIVHGTDLTYAAAVPKAHPWGATPQVFYDAVHGAMVEALRRRGIAARLATETRGGEERFLCFERRAVGDVVVGDGRNGGPPDVKVMGSAQRRLATAVLQHGSLLVRTNPCTPHLPGVAEVPASAHAAAGDGDVEGTVAEWLGGIARSLHVGLEPQPGAFLASDPPGLEAACAHFAGDRWTGRR